MININIEVRPEVKPIVFKSGVHLEDEKKQLREFFEANLLPVFSQIRRRV